MDAPTSPISFSKSDAETAEAFTRRMVDEPKAFPDLTYCVGFSLSTEQRERIALAGLRKRFDDLRGKVAALDRVASEQGIDAIDTLDDAAYLLFPHTVFKSYPLSLIETGRFDRLTRWLQGLTATDLSGFDATGVETIDGWIDALDVQCGVEIIHTSGTSGKISFLPQPSDEGVARMRFLINFIRDWDAPGAGPDMLAQPRPLIYPSYRSGATAPLRSVHVMAQYVARSEEDYLSLYPDRFSADVVSLAGRLRVAEARGEQGSVRLTPALAARRDEFVRREQDRPHMLERFFAQAEQRFAGRDVLVRGVLPFIYDWAEAGLARGLRGMFGPGTIVQMGGGGKGRELPPNAVDMICEFAGIERPVLTFGMSEANGSFRQCECGRYHIPPYIMPYVLDPATGEPLPRSGVQTGRYGFVDLFQSNRWGGFVSGDKVTLAGWDEPCACGRTGPYLEPVIQRFSELEGGDDKITCAGAPEAHDKAIQYLASISE